MLPITIVFRLQCIVEHRRGDQVYSFATTDISRSELQSLIMQGETQRRNDTNTRQIVVTRYLYDDM